MIMIMMILTTSTASFRTLFYSHSHHDLTELQAEVMRHANIMKARYHYFDSLHSMEEVHVMLDEIKTYYDKYIAASDTLHELKEREVAAMAAANAKLRHTANRRRQRMSDGSHKLAQDTAHHKIQDIYTRMHLSDLSKHNSNKTYHHPAVSVPLPEVFRLNTFKAMLDQLQIHFNGSSYRYVPYIFSVILFLLFHLPNIDDTVTTILTLCTRLSI